MCNYPETVTVIDLPTFAQHQEPDSTFSIPKIEDLSLEGTYLVTVRSQILVPDDYTKTTFTAWEDEFEFEIITMDPCKTSVLDDFIVENMQISVKGGIKTQKILDPTDLVSRSYFNLDGFSYCGAREFEIVTQPV